VTTPPAPRPPDRQTPCDPRATDRRAAIIRARCALSIVHAHYWRALARAQDSQETHARRRALAEARRLLRVAVALDQQAKALDRQRDPAAARRPDRPDAPQPPNASAGGTPTPLRAA
jgi:hypothetical protein